MGCERGDLSAGTHGSEGWGASHPPAYSPPYAMSPHQRTPTTGPSDPLISLTSDRQLFSLFVFLPSFLCFSFEESAEQGEQEVLCVECVAAGRACALICQG